MRKTLKTLGLIAGAAAWVGGILGLQYWIMFKKWPIYKEEEECDSTDG